jgi:hypothetical protein
VNKKLMRNAVGLVGAVAFLYATLAIAQEDDRGDWSLISSSFGRSNSDSRRMVAGHSASRCSPDV